MSDQEQTTSVSVPSDPFVHSPSFGALTAALAKCQGAMEIAKKDSNADGRKYADIASVIEAIKKAASENGICYIQIPYAKQGFACIKTLLFHGDEWIMAGVVEAPHVQFSEKMARGVSEAQKFGAALTYARRY